MIAIPIAFRQAQQQAAQTGQQVSVPGSIPLFYAGGMTSCLGGLPMLVFGVWGIIILFMLRNRVSACIRPKAMAA